jgi:hypothetical protein
MALSYNQVFGLALIATLNDFKHSYRQIMLAVHLDKSQHRPEAQRAERKIQARATNNAYEVLSDDVARESTITNMKRAHTEVHLKVGQPSSTVLRMTMHNLVTTVRLLDHHGHLHLYPHLHKHVLPLSALLGDPHQVLLPIYPAHQANYASVRLS